MQRSKSEVVIQWQARKFRPYQKMPDSRACFWSPSSKSAIGKKGEFEQSPHSSHEITYCKYHFCCISSILNGVKINLAGNGFCTLGQEWQCVIPMRCLNILIHYGIEYTTYQPRLCPLRRISEPPRSVRPGEPATCCLNLWVEMQGLWKSA